MFHIIKTTLQCRNWYYLCLIYISQSLVICLEIPNILTHEECDHIIKRAIDPKEGGMFISKAKGGLTPIEVLYNYTGGKIKINMCSVIILVSFDI